MIQSFADAGTEDVFDGRSTKAARKSCPPSLVATAGRKLDQLDSTERLEDLRIPPGNRLEALSGDRRGQHSIRINQQFRICFRWSAAGPLDAQIVDDH